MSDLPPSSSSMDELLAALERDPEGTLAALMNSPSGGVQVGPDPYQVFGDSLDPQAQVFVGRQLQHQPPPAVGSWGWGSSPAFTRPAPRSGPRSASPLDHLPFPMETVDATRSVGDLLQDFYTMDADELMDTQRLLYAGGWYGNVDILDVPWGQHDEATFSAWAQVITRAARYNQAGVKKTPKQILEEAVRGAAGGMGPGGSGGTRPVVSLSDPAGLRSTIDTVATNVLGRKATPDEQRMFVGVIHGMQRDSQVAAQRAQDGGGSGDTDWDLNGDGTFGADELEIVLQNQRAQQVAGGDLTPVEVVQSSPEAQAEEALRAANPTEAGAHDISNQFAQFTQLLRGVV